MKKGFTLIELLVVVLIIGILSAVALPQYTTAVEKSRAAEALTLMSSLRYAVDRYSLQKNKWTTDWDALDVEIPQGKNFTINVSCAGANCVNTSPYIITASRKAGETYALKTIVKKDGTATRCCGPTTDASSQTCGTPAADSKVEKYCYAIAGGNPADF